MFLPHLNVQAAAAVVMRLVLVLAVVAIALILSLEEHPQVPVLQVVQTVLLAEHLVIDFKIFAGKSCL